ncbi:hypothetical protein NDU88_002137 [Pleurodeles waltl]|uniref:Uncharacterized protein n=1 Tax=Pleurodeles waltl TaxID=8319 RepID=A0AAV7RCG2_PLEWA|nr:hypothetical protein NDU88_002137 [Pleurodeles waltl]
MQTSRSSGQINYTWGPAKSHHRHSPRATEAECTAEIWSACSSAGRLVVAYNLRAFNGKRSQYKGGCEQKDARPAQRHRNTGTDSR